MKNIFKNKKTKRSIVSMLLASFIIIGIGLSLPIKSEAAELKVIWPDASIFSIHGQSASTKATLDGVTISVGNDINAFSKSHFYCADQGGFVFTNSFDRPFRKIVIRSDDEEFMKKYAENTYGLGSDWSYSNGCVTWYGRSKEVRFLTCFVKKNEMFEKIKSLEFYFV